jgi:sodium/proline symporter
MLAGLFSATVSTADSQILSCSAALSQDLFPQSGQSYKFAKIGTLSVTALVLMIALSGNDSVFTLVTFAWSALASSLGPLAIVRIFQCPLNSIIAVTMMISGMATAFIWNKMGLSGALYEVLPGMASGTLIYGIWLVLKYFQKETKNTGIR